MSIASRIARFVGSRRSGKNKGAAVDVDAPTVPGNLAATITSGTGLTLTWDPSTDNVGVVSYEVEQAVGAGAFAWLATVAHPTVTLAVSGLDPAGVYKFRVRAIDAAGNMSGWGPSDAGLTVDMFTFVAPTPNGVVYGMTPDSSGGYYVFGVFTEITDANGTHARARIAHLDRNGLVTSWDPGSDQPVYEVLVVDADYVAVAKAYNATLANNTLGGFDCRGFGLVHRATGIAMSWDPAWSLTVSALARDGDWLYVGLNGNTTQHVKRHSLLTYTLSSWGVNDSSTGDDAWCITPVAAGILVGYEKTSLGWRLLSRTTNTVVPGFAVNPTELFLWERKQIPLSPTRIAIASYSNFTAVNSGAQPVKGVAIINPTTGVAEAWQQDVSLGNNGAFKLGRLSEQQLAAADGVNLRVYDTTTGATVARFTATGSFYTTESACGRTFPSPHPNRLIVFGNITALTANSGGSVLSGTSRMFVIDVP